VHFCGRNETPCLNSGHLIKSDPVGGSGNWKPHTRQHGITARKATFRNIHSHENLNSCANKIFIVHKFCYDEYAYASTYLIHSAYCSLLVSHPQSQRILTALLQNHPAVGNTCVQHHPWRHFCFITANR